MSREQDGKWERFGGFWEKLHYGLSTAALAGAAIFPAEQSRLVLFSVLEFAHGALWNYLKKAGRPSARAAHAS